MNQIKLYAMLFMNSNPKVIDCEIINHLKVLYIDGKVKVSDLKIEDNVMLFQRQI